MVCIVAAHRQVQVCTQRLAQRTKEVRHQFGRHLTHALAREIAVEHEVRATGQVQPRVRRAFVHRQRKAIAADATLVAECLLQGLAQRQRTILDGVVLVDMRVAVAVEFQRKAAVLADLLQHVIEETQPGAHPRLGHAIQIDPDGDAGLFRVAHHGCGAWCIEQLVRDLAPAHAMRAHAEAAYAEVRGKLQVGLAIADHRRGGTAPAVVGQVMTQHADARLARVEALVRKAAVDQHLMETDALRSEDAQQQVVRATEIGLGKTVGAQAILVAHHHQFMAGCDEPLQRGDHARQQRELFVAVDLLVGRLLDQATVAIEEKDLAGSHARPRSEASTANTRSFSSGVPMVMRSASPRFG